MGYNGGTASRFNRTKSHSVRQFYRTLIMCFLEYLFSPAFFVAYWSTCIVLPVILLAQKPRVTLLYKSACWLAKRLYDQP